MKLGFRTVMLVHQDRNVLAARRLAFEAAGFIVRAYSHGQEAFDALSGSPSDIVILGRSLPGLYGPDLFRRLRQTAHMPVIFVSSYGADLADEVPGADDYLDTGCSNDLLVNRAHAILLARQRDGLLINPARCHCEWRRTAVYLNMPEYLMLEAMAMQGVCTRFALMEVAYGSEIEMDPVLVDGHISAIQRKFAAVNATVPVIEMIAGLAYQISKWA